MKKITFDKQIKEEVLWFRVKKETKEAIGLIAKNNKTSVAAVTKTLVEFALEEYKKQTS